MFSDRFLKGLLIRKMRFSINKSQHRKYFIHELQTFGKRTSERSERVSFPKFCSSVSKKLFSISVAEPTLSSPLTLFKKEKMKPDK